MKMDGKIRHFCSLYLLTPVLDTSNWKQTPILNLTIWKSGLYIYLCNSWGNRMGVIKLLWHKHRSAIAQELWLIYFYLSVCKVISLKGRRRCADMKNGLNQIMIQSASWDTRIRTWTEGTKIPSATITPYLNSDCKDTIIFNVMQLINCIAPINRTF